MVSERRHRTLYWIGVSLVLLASTIVAIVGWLNEPFAPFALSYGIKPIASVHGRTIYLKRAVASLFYDRTALSLNGERCAPPNDKTDYTLVSQDAGAFPVFYRLSDNGLTVYHQPLRTPTAVDWGITIEEGKIRPHQLYSASQEEDYLARGLSKAQIPLNDLKPREWWQRDYWTKQESGHVPDLAGWSFIDEINTKC